MAIHLQPSSLAPAVARASKEAGSGLKQGWVDDPGRDIQECAAQAWSQNVTSDMRRALALTPKTEQARQLQGGIL